MLDYGYFAFLMLVGQLSPGPDMLLILKNSFNHNLRAALFTIAGIITGIVIHTTIALTGLTFLILLSLTFGSAIPSGIFMPTILIGSSLGGYAGIIIKQIPLYSDMSTSTFALVGAAALLGGIQRSAVSLCVIIMGGTGETKFLLPIVVTTVCAKWVGDNFNRGIYEIGMEVRRAASEASRGRSSVRSEATIIQNILN